MEQYTKDRVCEIELEEKFLPILRQGGIVGSKFYQRCVDGIGEHNLNDQLITNPLAEIVGVEIENEHLVQTQKTLFELLWTQAQPISDIV